MENRIKALADFLDIDAEKITASEYNEKLFEVSDGSEYFVLTNEEADEETRSEIERSLWAFNAAFICQICGFLDDKSDNEQTRIINSLEDMQKVCEGANDFVAAMIKGTCGLDVFVEKAIDVDGRGHFLASYDGKENVIYEKENGHDKDYWIYRIN
jgi:hypothetical protein